MLQHYKVLFVSHHYCLDFWRHGLKSIHIFPFIVHTFASAAVKLAINFILLKSFFNFPRQTFFEEKTHYVRLALSCDLASSRPLCRLMNSWCRRQENFLYWTDCCLQWRKEDTRWKNTPEALYGTTSVEKFQLRFLNLLQVVSGVLLLAPTFFLCSPGWAGLSLFGDLMWNK